MKNSIRTSHETGNENRNEIKRSQLLEIPCFHITPHTHTHTHIIHIIRIFKVARCQAHANSYIYKYTSVEIISFLEQI